VLHSVKLKGTGYIEDRVNFPLKMAFRKKLGFKSPLFCNFLFPVIPFTSKAQDPGRSARSYSSLVETAESNLLKPFLNSGRRTLA
jgi:hypothetical protein